MCWSSAAALVLCAGDPLVCSFEPTFLNVSVVEIFHPGLGSGERRGRSAGEGLRAEGAAGYWAS